MKEIGAWYNSTTKVRISVDFYLNCSNANEMWYFLCKPVSFQTEALPFLAKNGSFTLHWTGTGTGTGKWWVSILRCVLYTLDRDRDRYMKSLVAIVPIPFPVAVLVSAVCINHKKYSSELQAEFPNATLSPATDISPQCLVFNTHIFVACGWRKLERLPFTSATTRHKSQQNVTTNCYNKSQQNKQHFWYIYLLSSW